MICKNCNKEFKMRVTIDGKSHNLCGRRYCFACSPFKKHNTIRLETPKQGALCICRKCGKEYIYMRHKGMTKTNCSGCCTTIVRNKLKLKMIEYKGGKCKICGYQECKDALCFHHRNSTTKDLALSKIQSWAKAKAELDKCEILCINCHMEVHEKLEGSDKIIQMIIDKII